MELLRTYTVTSKRTRIVWIFKYDQDGNLRLFQPLNGEIDNDKATFLFLQNRFPHDEPKMLVFKSKMTKYFTIDEEDYDLSFDTFMNVYGKKTRKKESSAYWKKMTDANKLKAILGVKKLNNHIRLNPWKEKPDPIRYLKHERYNDEY